jgi:hypothetical protein
VLGWYSKNGLGNPRIVGGSCTTGWTTAPGARRRPERRPLGEDHEPGMRCGHVLRSPNQPGWTAATSLRRGRQAGRPRTPGTASRHVDPQRMPASPTDRRWRPGRPVDQYRSRARAGS